MRTRSPSQPDVAATTASEALLVDPLGQGHVGHELVVDLALERGPERPGLEPSERGHGSIVATDFEVGDVLMALEGRDRSDDQVERTDLRGRVAQHPQSVGHVLGAHVDRRDAT